MLVQAIENGFYDGKRVRKGDVFKVEDGAKSKWFVKVEGKPAPAAQKGKKGKAVEVEVEEVKEEVKDNDSLTEPA